MRLPIPRRAEQQEDHKSSAPGPISSDEEKKKTGKKRYLRQNSLVLVTIKSPRKGEKRVRVPPRIIVRNQRRENDSLCKMAKEKGVVIRHTEVHRTGGMQKESHRNVLFRQSGKKIKVFPKVANIRGGQNAKEKTQTSSLCRRGSTPVLERGGGELRRSWVKKAFANFQCFKLRRRMGGTSRIKCIRFGLIGWGGKKLNT